jgi:hypothetical protein
MTDKPRFCILAPDNVISPDTFVLADEQPLTIRADCLLAVHEASGQTVTVHQSRLIPLSALTAPPVQSKRQSVCLKCGKVQGVALDQVECPNHGDAACGMLEPKFAT